MKNRHFLFGSANSSAYNLLLTFRGFFSWVTLFGLRPLSTIGEVVRSKRLFEVSGENLTFSTIDPLDPGVRVLESSFLNKWRLSSFSEFVAETKKVKLKHFTNLFIWKIRITFNFIHLYLFWHGCRQCVHGEWLVNLS